ncbi:MAG: type II toxin-antitoxin system HicB family antitoxin [Candidatus Omnitrophica bacterium]|nr:type II toxin-antitoxin system HicB family antitoxin [Candidatus Omnitrophota bacterium]
MRQVTYTVLIEQDETGAYIAKVPDLRGCHTHARSIPELLKRVREAIELCLEVEGKSVRPLRFIGVQQVNVAV